jgi:hypothetical protein
MDHPDGQAPAGKDRLTGNERSFVRCKERGQVGHRYLLKFASILTHLLLGCQEKSITYFLAPIPRTTYARSLGRRSPNLIIQTLLSQGISSS